jgi:hypothetical protein
VVEIRVGDQAVFDRRNESDLALAPTGFIPEEKVRRTCVRCVVDTSSLRLALPKPVRAGLRELNTDDVVRLISLTLSELWSDICTLPLRLFWRNAYVSQGPEEQPDDGPLGRGA